MRSKRSTDRKAAEQGDGEAQDDLGNCYAKGIGVASNAVEAVKWYIKAVEHESEWMAATDLWLLLQPDAEATNSRLNAIAIELLIESAQRGNPYTQEILGEDYARGFCVSTDEFEEPGYKKPPSRETPRRKKALDYFT